MEQNNELETKGIHQSGLLLKVAKRIATKLHKTKIFKKVLALVVATSIGLTFVACSNKNNSGSVNIADSNNQHEETDITDVEPIFNDYSPMMKEIRRQLIELENKDSMMPTSQQGHPYTFLAQQGHDVQGLMQDTESCHTTSFVYDDQPNDLFMNVRFNPQYSCNGINSYFLKYHLTDQEMAEYHWLNANRCFAARWANDVISAQKQPEILASYGVDFGYEEYYVKTKGRQLNELLGGETFSKYYFEADVVKNPYDKDREEFCFFDYLVLSEIDKSNWYGQADGLLYYHNRYGVTPNDVVSKTYITPCTLIWSDQDYMAFEKVVSVDLDKIKPATLYYMCFEVSANTYWRQLAKAYEKQFGVVDATVQ